MDDPYSEASRGVKDILERYNVPLPYVVADEIIAVVVHAYLPTGTGPSGTPAPRPPRQPPPTRSAATPDAV